MKITNVKRSKHELKMPTRFADMSKEEMGYDGGATHNFLRDFTPHVAAPEGSLNIHAPRRFLNIDCLVPPRTFTSGLSWKDYFAAGSVIATGLCGATALVSGIVFACNTDSKTAKTVFFVSLACTFIFGCCAGLLLRNILDRNPQLLSRVLKFPVRTIAAGGPGRLRNPSGTDITVDD